MFSLFCTGKINDYLTHIYRKQLDLDKNNRTCGPGWKAIS